MTSLRSASPSFPFTRALPFVPLPVTSSFSRFPPPYHLPSLSPSPSPSWPSLRHNFSSACFPSSPSHSLSSLSLSIPHFGDYAALREAYRPQLPAKFNIGVETCDRHVEAGHGKQPALIHLPSWGAEPLIYSFDQLSESSTRLCNALHALVAPGISVGIYLSQSPEAAITHLAAYKAGCVAMPLFKLFQSEAVKYRLQDSQSEAVVTDLEGLEVILSVRDQLPKLRHVIVVQSPKASSPYSTLGRAMSKQTGNQALPTGVHDFYHLLEQSSDISYVHPTSPNDPALLIYTSGTTGAPKGCLHEHRILIGHLPGVEFSHERFPRPNDLFWTPADWAWIGGLLDVLLPSLFHGVPVLSYRFPKFDPDQAFSLMTRFKVQNVFMPATALKMLRAGSNKSHKLRTLASGGETLSSDLVEWGHLAFGVSINEFYGQTECNYILSNSQACFPVRPGSMGKAVPGQVVTVLDSEGKEAAAGQIGEIAVLTPNLTCMREYLGKPRQTAEKFRGKWLMTGDLASCDEDGYFWFVGRDDDVINSGGYRIGPGEVESVLEQHEAVSMAAVVGKPDPQRYEVIKAYVVLSPSYSPSPALAKTLQNFVKERLARHEYPREVEFVESLPTTTTGKIIRGELRKRDKNKTS